MTVLQTVQCTVTTVKHLNQLTIVTPQGHTHIHKYIPSTLYSHTLCQVHPQYLHYYINLRTYDCVRTPVCRLQPAAYACVVFCWVHGRAAYTVVCIITYDPHSQNNSPLCPYTSQKTLTVHSLSKAFRKSLSAFLCFLNSSLI